MSILLEALRKSENKRRPHETPTIHTEAQAGSSVEPLRTLPLALLLIAALLLTGWFVWKQYRTPAGSYQPPVTLSADQVHRVPRAAPAEQGDGGATAKPPAMSGARQKRTPVESYQPPAQSKPPTTTQSPSSGSGQPAAVSRDGNPAPATAAASSSGKEGPGAVSPSGNPATSSNAGLAGKQETTGTKAAIAEKEFHPGEPEPIGYWELPDAIRADVPEITFSVLVYAADPADRFVLINGQRLGEGDSLKPGLVVKEIRRDGVVFSYRLYQFLVER